MPTYAYKCTDCDIKYEQFFKVREEVSEVECPKCGSKEHKKLISTVNFGGLANSGKSVNSLPQFNSPCAGGICGLN